MSETLELGQRQRNPREEDWMASLSRSVRGFAIVGTSLIVRSKNLIGCPPIRHDCDRSRTSLRKRRAARNF
jgi:hypothetical protein